MTDHATDQRHLPHRTWASGGTKLARLAPDQAQAAGELVRVSHRSGRIGLAGSTPESFVGFLPTASSFGAVVAFR